MQMVKKASWMPEEDEQDFKAVDAHAADLLESFCRSLEVEKNYSVHTVRAYRIDVRDYLKWAKRSDIDTLRPNHRQLRRYLGELDQAQYSRNTINRRLSSLRGFFSWLTITGEIESDPASVLQGPKKRRSLPRKIAPSEMARILTVHSAHDLSGKDRVQTDEDLRDQAILEFLYACGARISEASGLSMGSVDFSRRQVKVYGKGGKERIIPIHDIACRSLKIYLEEVRPRLLATEHPTDAFFLSSRGNRMGTDAMRVMFKKTLAAAGVDETYTPHDMRHTFASDLLEGGADLRSVQEMLGHASLSTTQIYTHLSPEHLKAVHHTSHPRG